MMVSMAVVMDDGVNRYCDGDLVVCGSGILIVLSMLE